MKEFKRTFYKEYLKAWSICGTECGACYYRGPIVPHNWLELPPHEWAPPAAKCPSYEYFKFKAYTGVGRGDLASIVHDDKNYKMTDDLVKAIYTCTGCGMCSEVCYKLRPLSAIFAIREEMVERGAKLPDPLQRIDSAVDGQNNIFGAKIAPRIMDSVPAVGKDLYFAGCIARFRKPEVVRATIGVLRAAGIDVAFNDSEEKCCGLIPGHDGNTAILERKASQNIEAFRKAGARRIITSCAHCYKTLKFDYKLIAGDLPFEVVHVSEIFSHLISDNRLVFTRKLRQKITYHDPCFLGRYYHVTEEPRKVLRSIPGIKLVEVEPHGKWTQCCGSGTKITSNCYPEFTEAITKSRLVQCKNAADNVVTACTTCYDHMSAGIKLAEMEMQVYDLSLLVAQAAGIDY